MIINNILMLTCFENVICYLFGFISVVAGIMLIISRNPIHSIFSLIVAFIGVSALMFTLNLEFLPIVFLVVYVGAVSVLFLFVVMMLNIKIIETYENFFNYLPVGLIIGLFFFYEIYTMISSNFDINYFIIDNNNILYNYLNEIFILENKEWFEVNFIWNEEFDDIDLFDITLYDYLSDDLFDYLNNFFNIEYFNYINERDSLTDIEIIAQVIYQHKFFAFILASFVLLVAMIGAIVLTLTVKRDNISVKRQDISEQVYREIKLKIYKNNIEYDKKD